MKKLFTFLRNPWPLVIGLFLASGPLVFGQIAVTVTGATNTTPNLSASYTSLQAAVTALNAVTAMSGPVVLTCTAGGSETAAAKGIGLGSASLNAVLSATNTITINKSGGTVTLNAGVGTAAGPAASPDGIFYLNGADYVTIDGLTFTDGNSASSTVAMEFGLALFKRATTDGCNNNTIRNCVFNMQRINNALGSGPMTDGSCAIQVLNSTAAAATTALTPTNGGTLATNGTNSNNAFYSNQINGGNAGIHFGGFAASAGVGPAPTATTFLGDLNNIVGALGQGNTILNFGGGAATNAAVGIRANNQWGVSIRYNTVDNNNGSGVNHATTLRGIYTQAGTSAAATVSNNTVTVRSAATTSALTAIDNGIGSTAVSSNTININDNIIRFSYTTATTGIFTAISNSSTAGTVNINNNNIQQLASTNYPSTGTIPVIVGGSPNGPMNVTGNTISNFNMTGASGTLRAITASTPAGLYTVTGNTIENLTYSTITSTGSITGIYNLASATLQNINNNIIRNFSTPTTGTLNGIQNNTTGGTFQCNNNQIYNFTTTTGGAGGFTANGITWTNTAVTISGNQIYDINSTGTTGGTGGTINGITVAGTNTVSGNKIYNLSSNSTNVVINGIAITGGVTNAINNNLVGDLRAPFSTGNIAISGILVSSGTTNNIFHNTVNLAATTSSATTFGTSAIYFSSATPVNNLRNNVFVNTSAPGPTGGFTAAIRYTSAPTTTNFPVANNNNFYYAGTPAANSVIYCEGSSATPSNGQQTIANYKTYIATTLPASGREASSVSEAPTWVSTSGSSANFLRYNTVVPTQMEQGGVSGTGITTDFAGTTRCPGGGCPGGVSLPDMGAWELNGLPADLSAPALSFTDFPNTLCSSDPTLSVTMTDISAIETGTGLKPRLYYKLSTDANDFFDNVSGTGGWKYVETPSTGNPYLFTPSLSAIGAAPGSTIQYFLVAQDVPGNLHLTGGVSFNAAQTSVALTASAFPIGGTLKSYNLLSPLAATVNVPGDFPTLTGSGGLFEALNTVRGINANTTVNITSNISEPGTFALNEVKYGCSGTPVLTIKTAAAGNYTLSGAFASGGLIRLNGTDNVVIDGSNSGGTDRSLTITNSSTTAPAAVQIISLGAGLGATNATVKNCNLTTGVATTSYGISVGGSTLGTTGADNDNVTLQNNGITIAHRGIYAVGTAAVSAGGLDNLTVSQNDITINTTAATIGIQLGNALTSTVSQNTLDVFTTSGSNIVGISLENGFLSSSVTRNRINQVRTNTTFTGARGITIGTNSATSGLTVANNVISNINSGGVTSTVSSWPIGILVGAVGTSTTLTTLTGGVNLYYNSINLYGSMGTSSTTARSTCVFVGSNVSNLDVRNNVFSNRMDGTNTSQTVHAIYSQSANTAFTPINFNDYYVTTTGATTQLGFIASANVLDLAAWQTATGADAGSISADPLFATNSDLRPLLASPILDIAPALSVTTDFTGGARPGTVPGNSLGAFEVGGDFAGPVITGVSLPNTLCTSNVTLSATITDVSNSVVTTAGSRPRLYFKKSTDANAFVGNTSSDNGWKYVESTTGSSPFSFTTNFSLLQSAVVAGDVIQYFVVAQDNSPNTNVGISNSTTFTGTPANMVALNSGSGFPITGTITSYTIAPGVATSVTVGSGGDYPTLTGVGGFFADLNSKGLTANTTVLLKTGTITETGANALNQIAYGCAGPYTLTIRPEPAAVTTLSGAVASSSLIRLNGADFVIIDGSNSGGSDRSLTITNTSTTSPTAVLISSLGTGSGATNNTIRNCNISTGTKTSSFGISIGGATGGSAGNDNDNITIQNNVITFANTGIFSSAAAAGVTDNLLITQNTIGSLVIASSIGTNAINIVQANNGTISRNDIQGITSGAGSYDAVSLGAGVTNFTITRNAFHDLINNGTDRVSGLGLNTGAGANILITNNVFYNITGNGTGGITFACAGIYTSGGTDFKIYHNSFSFVGNRDDVAATDPNSPSACIMINTASSGLLDIRNNVFYNTQTAPANGPKSYAIYSTSPNTAFSNINYNDYFVSGAQGVVGFLGSDQNTLANWQAATGQDANSVSVDPIFNSSTNLNPNLGSTIVTLGVNGTGVTVDFDGLTRTAPVAMGAFETAKDASPPTGALSGTGGCFAPGAVTINASITDPSGVPTAGAGRPVCYWKKSTDPTYTASTGTHTGGGIYSFTIGDGSVVAGNTVQFYFVAQDAAGTPNVGAVPSTGASGFTANPPAASTPPTTPFSYTAETVVTVTNGSPYNQNFTTNDGWTSGGTNSTWARGSGAGKPTLTSSIAVNGGDQVMWATNLSGAYNASEASWVQSPCFNLAAMTSAMVRLSINWSIQTNLDGSQLQYSIDGGATWVPLGGLDAGAWYNQVNFTTNTQTNALSMGTATGRAWWSGTGANSSGGWQTLRFNLPNAAKVNGVKFRMAFASNTTTQDAGVAFDNFEILQPLCDGPPQNIAAAVSGTSVTVSWTSNPGATSGYDFQYKKAADVTWTPGATSPAAGSTSVVINGLEAGEAYNFQIRSKCPGLGDWSSTLNFSAGYDPFRYTITRNTGITYSSINGLPGTIPFPGITSNEDDDISTTVDISSPTGLAPGFDFRFQGKAISSMKASTNGWITFDPTVTGSTFTNDIGGSFGSTRAILAPLWDDLRSGLGADPIGYRVDGTAPNRIITIEYFESFRFGSVGNLFNFQVLLYEGSDNIEFRYDKMQSFNYSTPQAPQMSYSIGLKGWNDPGSNPTTADVIALQQVNTNIWNSVGTVGSYVDGFGANNLNREMNCAQRYLFTAVPSGGFTPGVAPLDNAAPVNDDPAGAITLTPSLTVPTNVCGAVYSSRNATATDMSSSASFPTVNTALGSANPDDDVWFKFIANAVDIEIRLASAVSYQLGAQILDENLDIIAGNPPVVAANVGKSLTLSAVGLTLGNTYFIRVFHAGGGVTATGTATISGGAVTGVTLGVGGSGYLTNTSTGTAPNTIITRVPEVRITGGGGTGARVTANVTAGAVTSFSVASGGSGYTSPPTVTVSGPGWGYNGEFAILVNATPKPNHNDNLYKYAIPALQSTYDVTVGTNSCTSPKTNQFTFGNNSDATGTRVRSYAACTGTADDTRWYRFVATSTLTSVSATGYDGFNPAFQVFDAGNGGLLSDTASMVSVACPTPAGLNQTTNTTFTTVPGNVYWIQAYHSGVGSGTGDAPRFDLCVVSVTPISYIHSSTSGTYTAITGTDVTPALPVTLGTNVSVNLTSLSLPDVTFNGIDYSSFTVNTNGQIYFGTPLSGSTTNGLNTAGGDGVISPFGAALVSNPGATVRVGQSGSDVVVQWSGFRRFGSTGESLDFQVRFNTGAGKEIRFVYGSFTPGSSTTPVVVGIRGAATTFPAFVLNRQTFATPIQQNWTQTTMGASTTSTVAVTSSIFPASGLSFTYAPTACGNFVTTNNPATDASFATTSTVTGITENDATLSWRRLFGATGYRIRYRRITDASFSAPITVSGQDNTTFPLTGLDASTGYYWEVQGDCGSSQSHWSVAGTFNTAASPLRYSMSQSVGTYTDLTSGGQILAAGTISAGTNYPVSMGSNGIPASITFNGTTVTSMFVNSNGFISLGGQLPAATTNPLSDNTALAGVISPSSGQLRTGGPTTEIRAVMDGSELVVQWKNMARTGSTGENISFQARIHTTTGAVRFVYGAHTAGTSTSAAIVGIRSGSNVFPTFVLNRTAATSPIQQSWNQTTLGSGNTSTVALGTGQVPATGLTFTYTYTATCANFAIVSGATDATFATTNTVAPASITQSGATLTWRRLVGVTGYNVRWRAITDASFSAPTFVSGQDNTSLPVTGLSGSTDYYWEVQGVCAAGVSHYSAAGTFATSASPLLYEMTQSTPGYTDMTTGQVLYSGPVGSGTNYLVDLSSLGGPFPASVNFNGGPVSTMYVNTNGFVTLGGQLPAATTNPLSTTGSMPGVLCPSSGQTRTSGTSVPEIRIAMDGAEFVVQWKNMSRTGSTGENISFQARIHSTNGTVRFVYGPHTLGTSTSPVAVGIRSGSTTWPTFVLNRTAASSPVQQNWTQTTLGTSNASTVAMFDNPNPTVDQAPVTGLAYTYTYTATCANFATPVPATDASFATTSPVTGITTSGAVLNWRRLVGVTSYNVRWRAITDANFSAPVNVVGQNTLSYTIPNGTLGGSTDYYWEVQGVCASGVSHYSTAGSFATLASPLRYNFTQTSGTYTDLTSGGIVLASGAASITTGTNFAVDLSPSGINQPTIQFNGAAVSSMIVNSNGFITLGGQLPAGTTNPLSTSGSFAGVICPSSGQTRVSVSASSEIRVAFVSPEIVVQWKNMGRTGSTGESISFQARINPSTGVVRFVYGTHTLGTSTSPIVVGMRSGSTSWPNFVLNRTAATTPIQQSWSQTTLGTSNSSTVAMAAPSQAPASGLTFTYNYTLCSEFPIVTPATDASFATTGTVTSITQNSAVLNWRRLDGVTGYNIRWRALNSTTFTGTASVVGAGTTSYNIPSGLTGSTGYYWEVQGDCGSSLSHWSTAGTFNTQATPLQYNFAQGTSTWTPITGGTVLTSSSISSGTNFLVDLAALGFPSGITFNGGLVGPMYVNSNGFISFGPTPLPAGTTNPLSDATAVQGVLAPSSGQTRIDVGGGANTIRVQVVGSELVVQWSNFMRSGFTGENLAFQARINTVAPFDIKYVYGPHTFTGSSPIVVGMRSGSNVWPTFVRNRATINTPLQQTWNQTSTGSSSTSAVVSNISNVPATGLTFTYTPTTCQVMPLPVVVSQSNLASDGALVYWTPVAGATGYEIRYRANTGSPTAAPYTSVISVSGGTTDNYLFTGLNTRTTYYYDVQAVCSVSEKSHLAPSGSFTTLGPPLGYNFDVTSGTFTPLTGATSVLNLSINDDAVANVTPSSPVEINGQSFNTVQVSTNGWIIGTNGVGGSTGGDYDPLWFTNQGDGVISPFSGDLAPGTGVGTSQVSWKSDAGDIVFEWRNVRIKGFPGQALSFQARYNLVAKTWRYVYGEANYGSGSGTATVGVGIRGGVAGNPRDIQNKVARPDWASPSTGTSISSEMTISSGSPSNIFPTNGLTYTWTPVACYGYPGANNPSGSNVLDDQATVTWNVNYPSLDVSAGKTGYEIRYRRQTDPVSVSSWITPITGSTSPSDLDGVISSLMENTDYYFEVRALCSVTDKTAWGTSGSFKTKIGNDVGVLALISPSSAAACASNATPVIVRVTNYGGKPQSNIPVSVNVTGPVNTLLSGTVAGPLAFGASADINLGTIDMSVIGSYQFQSQTAMVTPADAVPSNDLLASTIGITASNAPPIVVSATATPASVIIGNNTTLAANVTSLSSVGGNFDYTGASPVFIPDNDLVTGATMNISVSGVTNQTAGDLASVILDARHPLRGELRFTLTSPGGITIPLVTNRGFASDDFRNLTLGTSGPSIASIGNSFNATNVTTVYTPETPFVNFSSGPANGTWVLKAFDALENNEGTVISARLVFNTNTITNTWSYISGPASLVGFPFNGTNPPAQLISTSGTYNFRFTSTYSGGCSKSIDVTLLAASGNRYLGVDNSVPADRWSVPANWQFGAFVPGTAVEIPAGVPFPPTVGSNVTVTNLDLKAGASMSIGSGNTFSVSGNVTGGFNSSVTGAGTLVLNGVGSQVISGIVTANNVRISNTSLAGVSMLDGSSVLTLKPEASSNSGVLTMDPNSRFTTTPGRLVLGSNSFGTASLGPVPGNATFLGPLTIQRSFPVIGFLDAWYYIGTSIRDINISQLNDDMYTYGPMPGAQIPNPGPNTSSIFLNNEAGPAGGIDPEINGWEVPSAANNATGAFPDGSALKVGKGYRVYMRADKFRDPALYGFDFSGTPNIVNDAAPFDFNVNYSPAAYGGGGWNFVANPFPSAIDWDHPSGPTGWTKTNINNAIYIWNKTTNGSYVAGISTNGVTNIIPSSQGFFVKANAASPVLRARENVKSTAANSFVRTAVVQDLIRMTLINNTGTKDETVVAFRQGASDDFDPQFDAYELSSQLNIGTRSESTRFGINSLSPLNGESRVVPVSVVVPSIGTHTLRFTDMANFNPDYTVYLRDNIQGTLVAVSNGSEVQFTVTNDVFTQGDDRFELVIVPASVTDVKALKGGVGFRLHPNPSSSASEITLSVRGIKDPSASVSIVDVLGKTVFSEEMIISSENFASRTLDLNLPAGVYTVRFRSATASFTEKLIVR